MKAKNNEVSISLDGTTKKSISSDEASIIKMLPKKKNKKVLGNKSANLSSRKKKKEKQLMIKGVKKGESDVLDLSSLSSGSPDFSAEDLLDEVGKENIMKKDFSAEELLENTIDDEPIVDSTVPVPENNPIYVPEKKKGFFSRFSKIERLEKKIAKQKKKIKKREEKLNKKQVLKTPIVSQNDAIISQEKMIQPIVNGLHDNKIVDFPDDNIDIKLLAENLRPIKRCPKCNAKMKKSWIHKEDGLYMQQFECKNKGCKFETELVMKI